MRVCLFEGDVVAVLGCWVARIAYSAFFRIFVGVFMMPAQHCRLVLLCVSNAYVYHTKIHMSHTCVCVSVSVSVSACVFVCSALEFVWSQDSSDYAIREAGGRLKIFKNFTEKATVKIEYAIEGMHGGSLIGT